MITIGSVLARVGASRIPGSFGVSDGEDGSGVARSPGVRLRVLGPCEIHCANRKDD